MTLEFGIIGSSTNDSINRRASVSENGELIVREYNYSDPYIQVLTDGTVGNLVDSIIGKQFVMTGLVVSADKTVAAGGVIVELFEASSATTATQDKLLFSFDLARQATVSPAIPQVVLSQGKYLNTDRDGSTGNVTVTVLGFYIPRIN